MKKKNVNEVSGENYKLRIKKKLVDLAKKELN